MWVCPKCGREFARTNQGHYCGTAVQSVDEYIEAQEPKAQAHTAQLRQLIHRCVPGIKERIAWSMPYFDWDGRSVSFAACKKHISLYADAEILESLQPQFDGLTVKKNAIYLFYDRELPEAAIEAAVKRRFGME